jgi:hypothetical protein
MIHKDKVGMTAVMGNMAWVLAARGTAMSEVAGSMQEVQRTAHVGAQISMLSSHLQQAKKQQPTTGPIDKFVRSTQQVSLL